MEFLSLQFRRWGNWQVVLLQKIPHAFYLPITSKFPVVLILDPEEIQRKFGGSKFFKNFNLF